MFPDTQPQAVRGERSGAPDCLVSWVGVGLQKGRVEPSPIPATDEDGGTGAKAFALSW